MNQPLSNISCKADVHINLNFHNNPKSDLIEVPLGGYFPISTTRVSDSAKNQYRDLFRQLTNENNLLNF